ncbi:Protein kinase domain [Carpediemonas membranifera]|uniref:non-specific serine/threonine protein kinase n=1 Tax=Carpediemonas membranifera TaxID=201153 RepID=A0A8J6APQ6_9EUKA|nr:Protein kinase domain [Carpediemonas membranifera]|eukprot:KAG9390256.1 Protein kinase domain [Carpediemonas membranifera]
MVSTCGVGDCIPFRRKKISNLLIKKRYLIDGGEGTQLGSGSYGRVYAGRCIETGTGVAVKIERRGRNSLQKEADILISLKDAGVEVPSVYFSGKQGRYSLLVMDLLGPTLEDVLQLVCQYKPSGAKSFTLITSIVIALRLLDNMQSLHMAGVVHRDIKPQNFIFTLDPRENRLALIDYGLSKKFSAIRADTKTDKLIGTPRFASIKAHKGMAYSYGDDLESLAYTLIYIAKGSLPWWDVDAETPQAGFEIMRRKKQTMSGPAIADGLPSVFGEMIDSARNLEFGTLPDYDRIRAGFRSQLIAHHGTGTPADLAMIRCDWAVFADV